MDNKSFKIVSLFSGVGGFEEGITKSKIKASVIFSSEIDKYAQKSYLINFPKNNLHGDIKQINEQNIPNHDILVAGFPCQSFSITGKREGFNDVSRGTLFFDIARIIKEKKPKYILLENVKNLISHDKGFTIRTILNTLNDLDYTVDFSVLNSADFNVPQSRERTYIIGIYQYETELFNINNCDLPKVKDLKKQLNKEKFKGFNFFDKIKRNEEFTVISKILDNVVDDKYYFNSSKKDEFYKTLNKDKILNDNKTKKINKLFDFPKEIHNDMERQRRVHSINGLSPTLLARSDTTKILEYKDGRFRVRKFTPYENFKIQGFSNDFINNLKNANVSDTQLYKQSGNAVSPPVITSIFNNLYDFINKKLKFIDLFAGIGGFRLAFENVGAECVFSSEIDQYAIETYEKNFGEKPNGDISKIDSKEIPNFDILCAGFPCQPFSIGGLRLGFEDTRGTLFFQVARIIKEKKPKAFLLENVKGLVNHNKGNTLSVIENTLKNMGYILKYKVINALDYGIPQNRERWYCVGFRNDLNIGFEKENIPNADNSYSNLFSFPLKQKLKFHIEDIVDSNIKDYKCTDKCIENIKKHLDIYITKKEINTKKLIIANEIRPSRCQFRNNGTVPCLTAKMGTGGNNVPVIVDYNRKLTERECLRLMGYPEHFYIKENNYHSYKQLGNSVVIPIIESLAKKMVSLLE